MYSYKIFYFRFSDFHRYFVNSFIAAEDSAWQISEYHLTIEEVFSINYIGVGRFRILGGPRFRILGGGKGGPNSQQAHDVVMTSMRRNDVASTSFRRHVPKRSLINQCQIITFLILKYDIVENSRIELRGTVLPVQVGGLLGGPKGMLAPLSNYWGGLAPPGPPPPLPTPMNYIQHNVI